MSPGTRQAPYLSAGRGRRLSLLSQALYHVQCAKRRETDHSQMQRGATSYRGHRSLASPGRIGAYFTPRPQLFRVQLRVHDLHRRTIAHFAGTGRLLIAHLLRYFLPRRRHEAGALERRKSDVGPLERPSTTRQRHFRLACELNRTTGKHPELQMP